MNAILTSLSSNTQNNLPAPQVPLAVQFNIEYQDVAVFVTSCLNVIGRTCGLNSVNNSSRIHCANVMDRVRVRNGKFSFFYELPVTLNANISNGKFTTNHVNVTNIETAFAQNLPFYMNYGYCFSGVIHATDLGNGYVRIEVCDVK